MMKLCFRGFQGFSLRAIVKVNALLHGQIPRHWLGSFVPLRGYAICENFCDFVCMDVFNILTPGSYITLSLMAA